MGKFVEGLLLEKKRFLLAFKEGTVMRLWNKGDWEKKEPFGNPVRITNFRR